MPTESIYCLKCKAHRDVVNAKPVTMKNGRPALQGTCPICQGNVTRILSKEKAKALGLGS